MAFFYMYLVLVVLCCLNLTASNQPYFEDESRLTTDLLTNYVVTARPALKASDVVVVSVFPDIRRIDGIDEGIDTLSTSLQFAQKWNDPRLVWNKTDYGNISKIHLPIEQIWRPDIQLYNPAPESASGIDEFPVVVHSTGEVWYTPFVTLNSYCALNLKNFPYDIQECTIRLGSWLLHEQEMKIEFWGAENQSTMDIPSHNYGNENSEVLEHPSWSLIDKKGKGVIKAYKFDCCEEKWLALEIILRLQRTRQFYQYVLVGPGVILALLVPLQFLMPPSSTQRSLFGVILILTITVLVTSMKQYFPFEHSSVPRVGVFFIATMSFAAMAVFLSTIIASVDSKGKHRRAIPAWLSQRFPLKFLQNASLDLLPRHKWLFFPARQNPWARDSSSATIVGR